MKLSNLLIILMFAGVITAGAQSVEKGREAAKGDVDLMSLSGHLLAHPEPLVHKDIEDDDEDIDLPVHSSIPDSSLMRMRAVPAHMRMAFSPSAPAMSASPSPTDTFESTLDNGTLIPPDTHGAVDSNYCVTAVNSAVKIQSRTGGSVSSVSLDAFFSTINSANGTFDPRVHYDPYTNRWILICVSGANNSSDSTSILIAVSKTSNPTGAWWLYKVRAYTAGGYWLDFPDVGFNNKWITVTGNLFQNSPGTGYNGAKVFVFNKANLLAGTGASYTAFTQSSSFTICPALTYDASEPNMYAIERWNGDFGAMKLWEITGSVGSESMTNVSFPISPNKWESGSNQHSGTFQADFIPQASTSNLVQANDDRVTQMVYMNGYLWFAHTVFLPWSSGSNATRSSVQWWQMDTTGTPVQVGLIDDNSGTNFYAFPSLAVNTSNDVLIGFGAFSSGTYPSAAYAVRSHSDATDSIRTLNIFRHGQNSYYKTYGGSRNRWGDYSGAALDPINQTDFWTIQEASASTSNTWDTWWAQVSPPTSCTTPASITGTMNVCVGSATTLSDATTGGTWSSSNTSIATVGSGTGVVTGVAAGTVTITYSTGTGCNATATVTVNALPTSITGTASVCVGATTTLSSTPSGGTWTSATTSVATVGSSSGIVTGVASGTSNVTYTLTTGCSASTTVTVNALPGSISGTASVCVGATTTLSSTPSGGTWTSGTTSVATVGSSSGIVTGVASGTSNITYTLSTGCSASKTVTVNALPTSITGIASACIGSTTTLNSTPSGGTWTSGTTSVATIGSSSGIVTGVTAGTSGITYTLTTGCTTSTTVTVNSLPTSITGTASVCAGSTTTLSSTPSGGTWTSGTTSVATVGSSSGIVTGVAAGTSNITYTLTTGCATSKTVTVNALPTSITGTASVCIGSTTTLSSTPSGGTWTSTTTSVATVGSSSGIVTGVSSGTSNITYSLSGCSTGTTVTVNSLPTISLGSSPVVTVGSASANLPYVATTGSPTTYSITYSSAAHTAGFTDVASASLSGSPIVLTVPSLAPAAVYSGTLTVTGSGCTSAANPFTVTLTSSGGVWASLTHGAPHGNGGVMLLMTDGTILCKTDAGTGSEGNLWDKLTPDSHGSYLNGTWTTVAGMINDRLYFTSQVLRDGRVYVAGGEYGAGGSSAEVYDPVANTWSAAATSSGTPFLSDCNSELLPNGTVLEAIQSGTTTGNYIYNATSNSVSSAGSCFGSHDEAAWLKLPDSSILQVDIFSTNSERYIPSSNTWVHDATVPVQLYDSYGLEAGGAVMLPNGKGFFIGATGHTAIYTPSGTTSPGTWTAGPDIPNSLGTPDAPCAMMVNGKVLLAVSPLPRSGNHFPDSTYFYEYDYSSNSYTLVSTPIGGTVMSGWPTFISNMLDLPDGNVLYSYQGGGYYIYTPAGSAIASGQPTVSNIQRVNCDTFTATGTLFNGISEGSSYGDDWQNASNYPMVRLTSGSNVYYSRVYNWNSTGVMRGSAADTVQFILPSGLPTGSYSLQVVANGIASGSVPFNTALTITPSAPTVCVGSTVTLSDAWTGGSWSSSNTGVASVGSSSGVVTGVAAGTATITYTFSSGCYSTVTITVNASPSAITGTTSVCLGGSSTLASSPGGGTWTSSNTGIASVGASTGVVTGVANGTANITYTVSGCFVSTPVTVSTIASITGTPTVCAGQTTTLSDAATGGTWSSSNTAIASVGSATGIVSGVAAGTATITYSTGSGCFATQPVTVNAAPSAITGSLGVCIGAGSTLSSSPSGGVWTSANTIVATVGSSTGIVNGVSAGTADITYTLGTGCLTSTTVTVSTGPGIITGTPVVCSGMTTTLSDATGGGIWSSSNTAVASVGSSTGIVTGVSAGTATISYSLGAGCVVTTAVTVNTSPGAITGSTNVCTSSTSTLSSSTSGGTWTSDNTAVATVGSSSGVVTGVTTGTAGITYTMPSGCFVAATVTVGTSPSPITGTMSVCSGSTTTLSNPGAGTWSSSNTAIATVGSSSGIVTGIAAGSVNILFTTGCGAISATVTVNATPDLSTFLLPSATSPCIGSPSVVTINSPSLGAGTYTVTYSLSGANTATGATATLTMGASSGTFSIPASLLTGTGSTNVILGTISNGAGCSTTVTGSYLAIMTVYPLPVVYNVIGGGTFCAGGSGVHIGLDGSAIGTHYQLYNGGTAVGSAAFGTGSALDFGLQTSAGTYTVIATNGGLCTDTMTGSATITVNPQPTAYTITGGGGYCAGGTGIAIGLSGSDVGVNYQLYLGTVASGVAVAGTGSAISFGIRSAGGAYTVVATNTTTGCTNTMTGTVTVSVNPLPAIIAVTGGGAYCAGGTGVAVGLAGSAMGINYQLYLGGTPVGGAVAGTGSALSFGLQTTAGTYTVVATNSVTLCSSNMSGSATVSINSLPTVYTVTGGGSYCSGGTGVTVGLSGSDIGIKYQLYRGSSPLVGMLVTGTGAAISFGLQTTAGTYTVVATNAGTTCSSNMTGSATVTINPLPALYTVTGGGGYCSGGTGVTVGLSNSDAGVNYQLKLGSTLVGSAVAGSGSSLSFGLQTTAGTYTVVATNATTGCTQAMTGSATVTITPLPTVYAMTGGGSFCAGGAGVGVGLSTSSFGINYQLYRGGVAIGSPVSGTGGAISFGTFTTAGTYTAVATNATTGCINNMSGSATITVNPLPTVYSVTGGGSYCTGGTGVHVGLGNSDVGVVYQLFAGTVPVGTGVAGTGAPLDFGLQTSVGTYTVVATNATTGCRSNMSGSVTISTTPLPSVYSMTGGGSYCPGGAGVHVGLNNSNTGINYQLYLGTSPVGSPVAGTGSAIDFGLQTTAGVYTAKATNATTGCTSNMSGSVTISISALPAIYTVTGGGSYCSGGTGVTVGLSSSSTSATYQLYRGATAVGAARPGTGAALSFGLQTVAGTYTVVATGTSTGCTNNMSGSATVTINPLPTAFTVTGTGGYCSGGTGLPVGLSGSQSGVNYQLYRGTVTIGGPVAGTGSAISFGLQTITGTYTVTAVNTSTTCTNNMSGSATISINPLPSLVTVTGGGAYCAGGSGVHIGTAVSFVGTNYQLYLSSSPVGSSVAGTGAALDFGLQTTAGTYTVVATSATTLCSNTMSGSATVSVNPIPAAYTVTGGGTLCSGATGVAVGLSGSNTGINYQLYRGTTAVGSVVAGTGAAISFGLQTVAGTYTVVAISTSTSCSANMTGSATVTVNAGPAAYAVTGGGGYCTGGTGVHVGLGNSDIGVNYQLYRGTSAVGTTVAGTGTALDFGLQTTAGTYTVSATNTSTGCTANMTGSAIVTVNPLPNVFGVTGGGSYCAGGAGVHVGLTNSTTGVNYQLYLGGSPVGSPVAGVGAALDFGLETAAGTYTAVATNAATGCTNNMTGSATITINAAPASHTVTGGGAYCSGGSGLHVGLSGSGTGVSYQLYRGSAAVGSAIAGTGSALDFGAQTTGGTYTVTATTTATGCTATMTGSVVITVNPLPVAYTVTGGGGYCSGGTGVHVGLSGSDIGVSYQLLIGSSAAGSPVAGTGAALDFGLQTTTGTYTVIATNTTTSCINSMSGSAVVSIAAPPAAYTVTGGGGYCPGGSGVNIGLSGSQIGVSYQLYLGSVASGSAVAGTGSVLSFGLHSAVGTYTVMATATGSTCSAGMTGSAVITISALPSIDTVTGGGATCSGGPGVHIGLNTSSTGVNYQLYLGTATVGSPLAGTGGPLDFGLFMTGGTYTVVASNSTSCTATMSGSAVVTISPSPAIVSVTGGGGFCAGGTGVHVGLAASVIGVNYQLYLGGVAVGSPVAGIGAALDFGLQTAAGTYTATATYAGTSCSSNMSGSAGVTVYPLPTVDTITGGGGYCSGGTGVHIGLNSSSTGVTYKLLLAGVSTYSMPGTGSALDFGLYTSSGTYTVLGLNSVTGCSNNMYGSTTVSVNPNPTVSGSIYTVAPSGTITLTGSVSGGSWTSGNTSIATIGSSSGVVSGVALGTVVMTYTLPTGCFGVHSISVTPTGFRSSNNGIVSATREASVSVVPNPNHGTFTIKGYLSATDDQEVSLELTNMLGQVVYSNKVMAKNGELEQLIQVNGSLANGMYLLNMRTDSEHKMFHIVVEQ